MVPAAISIPPPPHHNINDFPSPDGGQPIANIPKGRPFYLFFASRRLSFCTKEDYILHVTLTTIQLTGYIWAKGTIYKHVHLQPDNNQKTKTKKCPKHIDCPKLCAFPLCLHVGGE